jgi:hypothetical protein
MNDAANKPVPSPKKLGSTALAPVRGGVGVRTSVKAGLGLTDKWNIK